MVVSLRVDVVLKDKVVLIVLPLVNFVKIPRLKVRIKVYFWSICQRKSFCSAPIAEQRGRSVVSDDEGIFRMFFCIFG